MNDLGPVIPIVTPCSPDGNLDMEGFRSVCTEMLEVGCKGIFVAGTTGRGPWFSLKDRVRLCETAAEQTKGKVLLFAGCTSSGLPGMLENASAMADSGAQIAVATVPTYFHYSQTEIETIYSKFADASPLPVIIYDIPEFTNVKLSNAMVLRLARHGNIIGFKDSSADLERFKDLVDTLKSFPDFYLMQGKENLIADSLRMGASGFIVSLLHINPLAFISLYRAVRAGNDQQAESIQAEINKAIKLVKESIDQRPESSTLFYMIDYALQKRGVCKNIMLDHDDKVPDWVIQNAQQVFEFCLNAAAIPQN